MSNADQCPSTVKTKAAPKERAPFGHSDATGKRYWRSAEDLRDTPEFREWLEREFPAHASELTAESRRDFLRIMGASLALAGAATIPGCRRPDHKIVAYNRQPEDLVIGNPIYYATAMPVPGGGALGLLARTVDGRPVKIEGNPLHPSSRGRTDGLAQACILDLYDPDRSVDVLRDGQSVEGGWSAFENFAHAHFAAYDASRGEGLAFLVEKTSSPSLSGMRAKLLNRWPDARWFGYEPIDNENTAEGARIAFGAPHATRHDLSKANVVLTIDRDFMTEPGQVNMAHGFAAGRRVHTARGDAKSATMNRLYAVDSDMTLTGGAADHRLRLKPSEIPSFALALARTVAQRLGGAGGLADALGAYDAGAHAAWIDAVAEDLADAANRGRAVVLVGENQPPEVHAAFHAVNAALGAVGPIVAHSPVESWLAHPSSDSIRVLTDLLRAGRVRTLVVIGANPVFDAPADLDFAGAFARAQTRIHLGFYRDETGAASTWHVNRAHLLESWGDVRAADGTLSAVQPMIAPIFGGKTELELLAAAMGQEADAHEIVRSTWRDVLNVGDAEFERAWRRALHDGFLHNSAPSHREARLNAGGVADALRAFRAPTPSGMEVVFTPDPRLLDGRNANNGWLQETPHPVTKITWDNPALISPATAKTLGVSQRPRQARWASVSLDGRTMDIPVWVQPGVADDTIVLTLGGGRAVTGRIGTGAGFNVYALRATNAMRTARGASIELRGGTHAIGCTQDHHAMEGRPLAQEFDLDAFRLHGDEFIEETDSYGYTRRLRFGDRNATESHTPANRDVYLPGQAHGFSTINPDGSPRTPPYALLPRKIQQWGMSIDLTMCNGCGACVTACQSENNIPVVGKSQVLVGREMHWIRVDRYFASHGDEDPHDAPNPDMVVQPVPCMHCETAPCEVVCPVNATAHGPEGTNDMAYNRCIGTRYCSNNCPYKVRRFNWFDYATKQFKGGFGQLGEGLPESMLPADQHWVPPRLRAKVSELESMRNNPNVTVRSRGVMEKCTYCIQRVNRAKVETKLQDLEFVPDGFFKVACQQACPTEAIVFGDITDPDAGVAFLREHARTYMMLGYLNTRPRTTYMARLRNPNPKLRAPTLHPFSHGHDDHGSDDAQGSHGAVPAVREDENGRRTVRLPVLHDASRRDAIASLISGAL